MDTSNIIIGLVVLMVLGVIMISVVIPTTQSGIVVSQYAGTVSNEVFTGVAATPSTLTKYVAEVITLDKANYTTTTNETDTVSNASTYTTLQAGASNVLQANLTYCYNNPNKDNASIYHQNVRLGNIPYDADGCATYAGEESRITGVQNITLKNINGTTANLTNVSFKYAYWLTNAAYTEANGKITPAANGTYRASYYYASTGTNSAFVLLEIIPLLLAVMLVLIVIGFWKVVGG